jgi:hypothetical protein
VSELVAQIAGDIERAYEALRQMLLDLEHLGGIIGNEPARGRGVRCGVPRPLNNPRPLADFGWFQTPEIFSDHLFSCVRPPGHVHVGEGSASFGSRCKPQDARCNAAIVRPFAVAHYATVRSKHHDKN